MALDTHPFRVALVKYVVLHGLEQDVDEEEGFDPSGTGPLKAPGQRLCKRVQRHMIAVNKQAQSDHKKPPYPGVKENGILDAPMRDALTPDRPRWQDELVRIVKQDAAAPNAAYYTQGGERWQGVRAVYGNVTAKPKKFAKLISGDCSAGVSRWHLAAWQSHLGHVPRDFVNGADWEGGYTGTIAASCRRVTGAIQIGDMPLYGSGRYHHVEVVIDPANKLCGNHGGSTGPNIVPWGLSATPAIFVRPTYPA